MAPISLRRIDAFVYRYPLRVPVQTSFGTMRDRPCLLVRVEDVDGAHGWGEVWCNWPACGAEHRAALLVDDLAELTLGATFDDPPALFAHLTANTEVKALQTGEAGPYAQAIAGLDIAAWDLCGRRAGKPIAALLASSFRQEIRAYASGIDSRAAAATIPAARSAGFTDFKIKIGFKGEDDRLLVTHSLALLEPGETLAADVNQGWSPAQAMEFAGASERLCLSWLEEPLRVDADPGNWHRLAAATNIPLAGGENLISRAEFDRVIGEGVLQVIQPDVAKRGGITGCHAVAVAARTAGRRYCPHYLGGGIGLAASAHLLSAVGGDGLLEIDVNPNPLREAILPAWPRVKHGRLRLPQAPGLGVEPDRAELAAYQVQHRSAG